MNDITEKHAKWLDDSQQRINEHIQMSLAKCTSEDGAHDVVDRAVPDPYLFSEQVFRRVAQYSTNKEYLGNAVASLVLGYLELDAASDEDKNVYDPVFDEIED